MRLDATRTDEALTIVLAGKLDSVSTPEFEARIEEILIPDERRVILDFSECGYVSSAGLRALLKITRRLPRKDGGLFILNPGPSICEVLDATGFDRIVNVIQAVQDAFPPV